MGPKSKSRVATISEEERRKRLSWGSSSIFLNSPSFPPCPMPIIRLPLPVQSQVAPSSCPDPSTKVTPLYPWHLNSLPLPEGLAVRHRTPGRLRAHLRATPANSPRRAHRARAGAGTPLLGGRNRRVRPLPQEATAPRRPGRTAPGPPPAARSPWPAPHPPPVRLAPRARVRYLRRPQNPRPTPLPLPPPTARTRAGSRARLRSPDPEEAGRTRRCGQPRPGLGAFGREKSVLPLLYV